MADRLLVLSGARTRALSLKWLPALLGCTLLVAACGGNSPQQVQSTGTSTASSTVGSTTPAPLACTSLKQLGQVEQARAARQAASPFMLTDVELLEFLRQAIPPLTALAQEGPQELRASAQRLRDDVKRQIDSQNASPEEQAAATNAAGSPDAIAAYKNLARYAEEHCAVRMEGA